MVLLKCCSQNASKIWKTQQWPQNWKRSVFIPILKKGSAKECSNYCTIVLISHASKVMLKILRARLQQYVNKELPDVQFGFRKGRGTRDQIANICWIIEKAREFHKNVYFCFIDYAKPFDCAENKLYKILKEMGIPDYLTCLLRNLYAGQEAAVRTGHGTMDWFQIGKGVRQGCILPLCLFNLYAEYLMQNAGLDEAQAGIKTAGRSINNLRYAEDTTLMAESEEEWKSLLMKVKEESEKADFKFTIQKTKIMASDPITSWQIDGETMETVIDFILLGSTITADVDCSPDIKRHLLLEGTAMKNLDSILKSRDITLPTEIYISQSYGFSSSHVWMWELDYKEGWALKNWCFWTALLEKTLESPLNGKEIKSINITGNQPWIFTGRTEAAGPVLWPPDVKSQLIRKDPDAGKNGRQEEKGRTWNETVGWHHQLNEHEFEQTPEDSEGQGSLGVHGLIAKSWTWFSNWATTVSSIRYVI